MIFGTQRAGRIKSVFQMDSFRQFNLGRLRKKNKIKEIPDDPVIEDFKNM